MGRLPRDRYYQLRTVRLISEYVNTLQSAILQAGGADRGHSALLIPGELSGVELFPGDVGRSGRHW